MFSQEEPTQEPMPHHNPMRLKEIKILSITPTIDIEVRLEFPRPGYRLTNVTQRWGGKGYEISIDTIAPPPLNPDEVTIQVIGTAKQNFRFDRLPQGQYYIRLNGNNDWVKWFKV